jgi:subtilisin family serine protease
MPTIGKKGVLFANGSGTSASAALTSGAIALIRSKNPHMPARTVMQRLIGTAKPLGGRGWNSRTGYGAIQITSAMNPERYPVPANAPNPVYAGAGQVARRAAGLARTDAAVTTGGRPGRTQKPGEGSPEGGG